MPPPARRRGSGDAPAAAAGAAARRPHLLVTEGGLTGTRIGLTGAPVLIGRANDSTLVLDDDYASTRHARISLQDGMWVVEDLGSTNGTYLGQRKLDGPTPMEIGVPLRIGKTAAGTCADGALILRYAVRSDLGLVRSNNEDSVYAGPRLLAIADGMGGHAAGEVASKIVIGTMERLDEDRRIDDLIAALRAAVADANHAHRRRGEAAQGTRGHGHHAHRAALRRRSQVGLVHVGDSRAYLLRSEPLTQITHDDTYVQYLVDSGKLTPDEAKDHPRNSVILRALLGTEVEPDVSIREARHGDRYLLCSDGLSDVVSTAHDPRDAAAGATRRSPPTGSSSSPCAAAGRTTSPSSSPT